MAVDDPNELSRALCANEIVPYFMPVVDLGTGRLVGFEVLARWEHPTRGLISPDRFIPMAENAGLIASVTEQVLIQTFTAARVLPEPLLIGVNVSPIQLRDRALPQLIAATAERASFSLSRLTIEITESALIENLAKSRPVAEELKALGMRLAIDDFGTGYSSLRHLQALPFDVIKVDASFVRTMVNNRESRKIVAAVVGLGQSLGLTTAAEGVEHRGQAEMLFYLGCNLGQGWLYGPAVPVSELPAVLSAEAHATLHEHPRSPLSQDHTLALEALPGHRLAQLQAIYDGVPVGLCYLDRNLRYVSINKRLAEMNGFPVEAHIGRPVAEVMPKMFPTVEPQMRRALNGEGVDSFEVRRKIPSLPDPERTLLLSYHPARDEAGEVLGISVAVVDITDHKRAADALAESEDHYRKAVELSPQILWTADAHGMILEAGPLWESLTGLTQSETLNEGWVNAIHPDDRDYAAQSWKASVASGRPVDLEYRIRKRDGEWLWVRGRAAPRRDSNGEILRWYGNLEDIDRRKKAEAALFQGHARLQAVFNASPLGMVLAHAPEGRIVSINPVAEKMLGAPGPAGLIAWRAYDTDGRLLTGPQHPVLKALEQGIATAGQVLKLERNDGSQIQLRFDVTPILDQECVTECILTLSPVNDADLQQPNNFDRSHLREGHARGEQRIPAAARKS